MDKRYHSLGLLADGGMADIELARDLQRDQLVAVKRIKRRHCDDAEFARMFDDEARIWSLLKHPNIVALLDHGCDVRGPFIAMELIDGCDLIDLLHAHLGSGLPLDLALTIAATLLDALAYLHEVEDSDGRPCKLVHRDVSPGNVLCARSGQVKLTDFGVAQAAIKTHETRVGDLKGKFAYMSPEQTRGQLLTAASDIFSTGVVLWEMLAGQPLFDRSTDVDTAQAVRDAQVPRLQSLRPDVPEEMDTLLGEMLQPDPEQRTLGAETVAQRLRRLARQQGLRLGPEPVRQAVERCVAFQAPLLQRVEAPERRQTRLAPAPRPATRAGPPGVGRAALAGLALVALVLGSWQLWWRQPHQTFMQASPAAAQIPDTGAAQALARLALATIDAGARATLPPDAQLHDIDSLIRKPRRPLSRRPLARTHVKRRPQPKARHRPQPSIAAPPLPVSAAGQTSAQPQTGIGWLDISSEPWAQIAVDGVAINRNTPLRGHALPAGRHRITLRNPVFDITRSIEVSIQAGRHLRRRVDLMPR